MVISDHFRSFQTFHMHLHLNRESEKYLLGVTNTPILNFPHGPIGNNNFLRRNGCAGTRRRLCVSRAVRRAAESDSVCAEISGNFPGNLEGFLDF